MRVRVQDRSEGRGAYTKRVNALALVKTKTEAEEKVWIGLIGQLAALVTNAADSGHVTTAVHRQLENFIGEAESKLGIGERNA